MTDPLSLFEVPVDFHGTSVGLSRHTAAGEAFCGRCQAFVDELVAAGRAAQLDEAGTPAQVSAAAPAARPIRVPKRVPASTPAPRVVAVAPERPRVHPLSRVLNVAIALHEEAGPYGVDFHIGLRCGSCRHRRVAPEEVSGRAFPKCALNDWARATQSVNSDCFSYWPACADYEPREAEASKPNRGGGSA